MRFHIRHSIDMTIHCMTVYTRTSSPVTQRCLKDLSEGGLCFQSALPVDVGTRLYVRIPVESPALETRGTVAWSRRTAHGYEIGVRFDERPVELLHMVGRACEIKHYRRLQCQGGRRLTTDQAAREWLTENVGLISVRAA